MAVVDDLEFDDDQVAVTSEGPFTGEVIERTSDGRVVAVQTFRDGFKDGEERHFAPDGQLLYEATCAAGRGVGVHQSWYENGQLEQRAFYENGWPVRVERWSRDGTRVRG